MKKIFYALMACAALTLSGCNKELLNTNPTDAVSGDTVFTDTEGGMMALNGAIRFFWQWGSTTTSNYHQSFGPQSYNLMADLMGEDMVQAASGNGWFWYDYNYNAGNSDEHQFAGKEWWQEAFSHDYVVTREEMKRLLNK